ncbi:tetratricopeptide (TPR) repeat protein [Nocardia transvalensis]|uniref:Tetratricopeptide (TPR) repeat protein n=2 Tax=Nocardia transvalensis TaxID=37333 RepID=A0A7W9ULM1_9NOCA|nr:tetratricopeptide repeat protein [Nocardia transvalensis]MBB5917507.1 tetratricopeptide (TPR) repeat protein [Nocardia transvalensis]
MSRSAGDARSRFQAGVARAVAQLGGDRAAEKASGISKSIWYDAKRGRSIPDETTTWPAMRDLLTGLPMAVTGVRNWDELYAAVLHESGRFHQPRASRRQPISRERPLQLPPTVGGFVARSVESAGLERLLIQSSRPTIPIVVVVGQPGVGKTALAVHWASRVSAHFPDGVLYTDLRGWGPDRPLAAEEVLPGWLRALGVGQMGMVGHLDSLVAALRSALSAKQVLIVIDNAWTEEQVRPLLPGASSCSVLITSRQAMPGLVIQHAAHVIRLEPLSEQDSRELLRAMVGDRVDTEPEAVAALIRLCGRLPLALRVVAETIRARPGTPMALFVEELADSQHLLTRLGGADPRSDPRTVVSWSYRQLPGDIAAMFRLLGLFPGHDLHPCAAAALVGMPPSETSFRLRTLVRLHLARETGEGRIELHDLIRLYAAEVVGQTDDPENIAAARRRLFDHYLQTAYRADELIEPLRYRIPLPSTGLVPTPLPDRSAALAWFDAERANIVSMCAQDRPELDTARWQLALLARAYFFRAKCVHEWIHCHEHALAAAVRSGDSHAEAMVRSNLGLALHQWGDDEAAMRHYRVAQRFFEEFGDIYGLSNTRAHQAAVLRRQGDFAESLRLDRLALDAYRCADNRRNVAITLRSIGVAEQGLGLLDDAERHLAESLELCNGLGLHMDAARASSSLGWLHLHVGRNAAAERSFRDAIAADQAWGGRYETALALQGMGEIALRAGDLTEAEAHWTEAVHILVSLGSPKADELRAALAVLRPGDRGQPSA